MRHVPFRVGLFVLLFLFMNLGTPGVYAAVTIQASSNSAKPGDSITLNGTTAPNAWVSLRALDQSGSILYFYALPADNNGQFSHTFKVPATGAGTLQLVAGQGSDVAAASIVITNPIPPIPPAPDGGGGGGGGGGSSPAGSGRDSGLTSGNQPITKPQPEFKPPADIAGHWARESIIKLIKAGVMAGYPDGTFRPDRNISRAEFTVIIVKALQLQSQEAKVFADSREHWARESIAAAAANGLISGYDQNTFGPDDPITREQAVVIIVRAAKLKNAAEASKFNDSSQISSWAKGSVAAAVKNAFIIGYPDGSFKPRAHITRAEAATIICKLLKK